jgi:hypothetical protein
MANRLWTATVTLTVALMAASCTSSPSRVAVPARPSPSARVGDHARTASALRHCLEALDDGARVVAQRAPAESQRRMIASYRADRHGCMAAGDAEPSICDAALGNVDAYLFVLPFKNAIRARRRARRGFQDLAHPCRRAVKNAIG